MIPVFAGGERANVARVRNVLPDASYASWRGIRGAVGKALASGGSELVVPGQMAGYSGAPLPRKLGLRSGRTLALIGELYHLLLISVSLNMNCAWSWNFK